MMDYEVTGLCKQSVLRVIDKMMKDGFEVYNIDDVKVKIKFVDDDSVFGSGDGAHQKLVTLDKSKTNSKSIIIQINKKLGQIPDFTTLALSEVLSKVLAFQHKSRFSKTTDWDAYIDILNYYSVYMKYCLIRNTVTNSLNDLMNDKEYNIFSSNLKQTIEKIADLQMNDESYTQTLMYLVSAFAAFDGAVVRVDRPNTYTDDLNIKLHNLFSTQEAELTKSIIFSYTKVSSGHSLTEAEFNRYKLSIKLMNNIISMKNETAIAYFDEHCG